MDALNWGHKIHL